MGHGFLVCNMKDRFEGYQNWSIATVFLLEALLHANALGRSEILSSLQRIIGPILSRHTGYIFSALQTPNFINIIQDYMNVTFNYFKLQNNKNCCLLRYIFKFSCWAMISSTFWVCQHLSFNVNFYVLLLDAIVNFLIRKTYAALCR